jgi:hypothetical protein
MNHTDKAIQDAIDKLVADWPPLTEETKHKLAAVLSDLPGDL